MSDLVFLPGWGYRSSVFTAMLPYFSDLRVRCMDLPLTDEIQDGKILVGWSLGGLIAMTLCAQYPDRYQQLILLSCAPKFPNDHAADFMSMAENDMTQTLQHFIKLTSFPSRSARQYFAAHADDMNSRPSLHDELAFLFDTDMRETLASLKLPILSLHGSRDAVLPASANSQIIDGAGHGFIYTHAAQTSRVIRQFMEQHHASS